VPLVDELGTSVEAQERTLLRRATAALRSNRARTAHRLFSEVLETAGDAAARAEALAGLGHVAHASGRPREAVRLFEDALRLFGQDVHERPDLAEPLGRAFAAVGELERATVVFERCLRRAREDGDAAAQVRFASLLSYALTDRGEFEQAERALAEVLCASEGVDDPSIRARIEWAQARLRGEQGQTEVALEHARTVLELLKPTEHTQFLALTYELLASLSNDLGRPEEAQALLREGWPLMISSATPLQVAHYRIEEARALAALGQHEGAAAVAMRVAAQLDGTHPGDAGRAYVLLGEIFDRLGDVPRARQLYETGIGLLSRQGASRYLADAYRRLAELFEAEYRTEDAVAVLKRALAIQARVRPTLAVAAERPT
jgi:tetratricopeptide (TPR) repeat protein